MRSGHLIIGSTTLLLTIALIADRSQSQTAGDRPVLPGHIDQNAINAGKLRLDTLVDSGRFLFTAKFNKLGGFGRPAATGNPAPTKRTRDSAPFMIRTSGPDSNSCAGCHNDP